MAKALIKTKNGLKIEVEGTPEEIAKIVSDVKQKTEIMKRTKQKVTATAVIRKLEEDGFFDKSRNLSEIKEKLAEHGLIYPITSLPSILLPLIRRRELGRTKTGKKWGYVKR